VPFSYDSRSWQGPALIKRRGKVVSLILELLKQKEYKISVKTRLGLDSRDLREGRIFRLFEEFEEFKKQYDNFSHVVVHFKTARDPSFTSYDYTLLEQLTNYNVPIYNKWWNKTLKNFQI